MAMPPRAPQIGGLGDVFPRARRFFAPIERLRRSRPERCVVAPKHRASCPSLGQWTLAIVP